LNKEEIRYLIALCKIKEIGPVLIKKILNHFNSVQEIFKANIETILAIEGIKLELAKRIKSFDKWDEVDKLIDSCEKKNIDILAITENRYPKLLKEINDPPPILFCKGIFEGRDNLALAVVGSRKLSEYGKRVTEKITNELASMGITIVSGLARGIDSIAHTTALATKGRTIAILGSGLSIIYPPENKKLAEKIINSGALISEFYPDEPPKRENFPKRNRLISGITLGTVVTEATINSGALITANFALEQGREVFAVPGNITTKNSEGTNLLIKKGAKLVQTVEDIVEEIKSFIPLLKEFKKEKDLKEIVDLSDTEQAIFNLLDLPLFLDEVIMKTGMSVSTVLESLLQLEIKGLIEKFEGKYVRRI
jgi:DNA processing protein